LRQASSYSPLPSAWAFSQQNVSGGDGNSSFTDPDDQITKSFGVRSNEQPMQLGVQQQGTFDPIQWEQSLHGYGPYQTTPAWQMKRGRP
jgi:hypothetical protein